MLQLLPQIETLVPDSFVAEEVINYINSYIKDYSCKNMSVDISFMNVIDACRVSNLCSTTHYIKYPDGKINWKISSEIVRDINKRYDLGNTGYSL